MKKLIALALACALSAALLAGCAMDDPQNAGASGSAGGTGEEDLDHIRIAYGPDR